jgi:undecaprenyl-diphosphatase
MRIGILFMLVLAVVQGLTEFLPVSSSGHLVLAEALLGVRERGAGMLFEVAVHIGTLCAILLVYRERVRSLIAALCGWVVVGFRAPEKGRREVVYAGYIVVASIPAAAAGLLLRDTVARAFDSPAITSVMLIATGCFLLLSRRREADGDITFHVALLVGAAQAVAILPGCSRSGWTITTALLLGVGFRKGAEFSFLLSVPAIIGALVLETVMHPAPLTAGAVPKLIAAVSVAFLSGWIALRLLLGVLARGRLHRFAYYLIPAGFIALLYFTLTRYWPPGG